MKKLLCVLSLILIAAILCPMAIAAESDTDEIYAEAITVEGEEITLADAPDAEEIPDLESYDLMIGDEAVLTVEQTDTPSLTADLETGGYFNAEFDIPETTKRVFLAGLSADKVEEIQDRIIENYAGGEDFELEDLSFIDTEKTNGSADDSSLCWAATASNMLAYTGWATQADPSLETTDEVFESFIDAFNNKGGSAYYGIGWFFNGVNPYYSMGYSNGAQAASGTGAFLTDYAFDRVSGNVDFSSHAVDSMNLLYSKLRDGCAVGLGHDIYYDGEQSGGHADTCWGYIADTAYDDTEPEYYAGLFITDSDTDKRYNERRDAPNIMQEAALTTGTDSHGDMTFELDLDRHNHSVLDDFDWLMPYSSDVEKETSSKATRNKTTTIDYAITDAYLGTDVNSSGDYDHREKKIESGTSFYYTPFFENLSDKSSRSNTAKFSITFVNDATGRTAHSYSFSTRLSASPYSGSTFGRSLTKNGGLTEGDYTVTMSMNTDQSFTEAYYYNNTITFPLKVRDSFLIGDIDSSGKVDVMDATQIQRYLAGYDEPDDKAIQRGALTKKTLDIMDATQIQRYLAGYTVKESIAEKKLYD